MQHSRQTPSPGLNSALDTYRIRGLLLMTFCLLFLAATGARLWYVQATFAERFEELNYFENVRTGPIPASRGRIFDCYGRSLADKASMSRIIDRIRSDTTTMS